MNSTTAGHICAFLSFMFAAGAVGALAQSPSAGDAALGAGKFDAAASAYAAELAANPNDSNAELGIGTIELYRNHVDAARTHLQRALELTPGSRIARVRLDSIAKRTGGPADYQITFAGAQARAPLVAVDPLPTLKATINGVPVTLVIDTGAPGVGVSEELASRLHLRTTIAGEGVFAGGLKAQPRSTRIERFDLPGVTVRQIPSDVMPRSLPGVDGIIGTGFLYHFLATIDYVKHDLVLRPPSDSASFLAAAKAAGDTTVPMWLAGDHFVFAPARVNAAPEGLYAIDTGGPGIGVDLTKATLAAAGITPDAAHPQSMMGGGGATQVLPFIAASVTIGRVTLHDLPGVFVPSGGLSSIFPFSVAGTISHEFFRHTAVTFDFAAMTLVLQPG